MGTHVAFMGLKGPFTKFKFEDQHSRFVPGREVTDTTDMHRIYLELGLYR